jgi:hypothetical protein
MNIIINKLEVAIQGRWHIVCDFARLIE